MATNTSFTHLFPFLIPVRAPMWPPKKYPINKANPETKFTYPSNAKKIVVMKIAIAHGILCVAFALMYVLPFYCH